MNRPLSAVIALFNFKQQLSINNCVTIHFSQLILQAAVNCLQHCVRLNGIRLNGVRLFALGISVR